MVGLLPIDVEFAESIAETVIHKLCLARMRPIIGGVVQYGIPDGSNAHGNLYGSQEVWPLPSACDMGSGVDPVCNDAAVIDILKSDLLDA